jgi:hypothetical protein
MLIDKVSNLNVYDGSIDMKFSIETCRPLIPSTNSRHSSDDQHVSKGSIVNKKQHEAFIQDPVSYQNPEIHDLLENHFSLQDTFRRPVNGSSQ